MIIDLSTDLKPAPYGYKRTIENVLLATVLPDNVEQRRYKQPTIEAKERVIRHSIPEDSDEFHANYMTYLISGYAQHYSIVLNPDIVWFAIMNEIAKGVIEFPEQHRSIFTKSPDKIELSFGVGSADEPLPLNAVITRLTELVPVDVNLFLPRFTTTSDMARLAHLASFAETCTPYYSYSTFCCGYPKIRIDGTPEDYDLAVGRAVAIFNIFDKIGSPFAQWMANMLLPWLSNVADAVHNKDADYFGKILSTERCGSGGEIEVNGWWSKVFRQQPKGIRKPDNFPTQIARVPWKNLDTGRKFALNCGVFHSRKDADGFLNPEFGFIQNEIYE